MPFHLDVRTVLLLQSLACMLMMGTLWFGTRHAERASSVRKWVFGLALIGAGTILVGMRDLLPPALAVVLADGLLAGGLCVQVAALLEFGGRRVPRWLAFFGPAVTLALLPFLDNFVAYSVLGSAGVALPLLALGVLSWRIGYGAVRWPMGGFYVGGAALLSLRAVHIVATGGAQGGVLAGSTIASITFAAVFALTITGCVGFLEMHRGRAAAELRRLAMVDPLTGVLNRRAFLALAERERARAARKGQPIALLMADIDHFKRVNDVHGHAAGDQVLAAVAHAMRQSLRQEDLVARYGGEEFCALLAATDLGDAMRAAERVRRAVAALELPEIGRTPVTISLGVAPWEPAAEEVMAAVARADQAMYAAKQAGRNRVAAYSPSLGRRVQPTGTEAVVDPRELALAPA